MAKTRGDQDTANSMHGATSSSPWGSPWTHKFNSRMDELSTTVFNQILHKYNGLYFLCYDGGKAYITPGLV